MIGARTAKIEPENLGDRVYQDLRMKLLVGDFQPGEAVSIRKLAAEYGTSAMPVREALKRLSDEKALVGAAKKAYRVPDLSAREAGDLFFVRSVLEAAGAEAAATRMNAKAIAALKALVRTMEDATRRLEAGNLLENNFRFHTAIAHGSGNPVLGEMVESIYVRTGPWLAHGIKHLAQPDDWKSDHADIVAALQRRDAAAARGLIERDTRWGMELYRRQA